MHLLMEHYYIGKYNSKNTEFIILCLLHELRIMTAKQLLKLLNFEFQISNSTLQRKLVELTRNELIGRIKSGTDNNGVGAELIQKFTLRRSDFLKYFDVEEIQFIDGYVDENTM